MAYNDSMGKSARADTKKLKLYDIKSEFLDREVKFKLPDISKNDHELWLALER